MNGDKYPRNHRRQTVLLQGADVGEEISDLLGGEVVDESFGHQGRFSNLMFVDFAPWDDLNGSA